MINLRLLKVTVNLEALSSGLRQEFSLAIFITVRNDKMHSTMVICLSEECRRGFLEAGASALIGILWSVTNEVALKFTQELYDQLSKGNTPREAIKAARIAS